MTKRALVQLASRALAVNLLLWSIYSFMYIPVYSFSRTTRGLHQHLHARNIYTGIILFSFCLMSL